MHKYYYHLGLIGIIVFICAVQLFHIIKEGYKNQISNMVLIGDSIFDNQPYVPEDKSVKAYLTEKTKIPNLMLAKDEATCSDTMIQYKHIPEEFNTPNTALFISMGANDILNSYENDSVQDDGKFNLIWNSYKNNILHIKDTTTSKIVLTNVYYVTDPLYSKYLPMTRTWNKKIQVFAKQENINVLDLSKSLTKSRDFTNGIEPSVIGGELLVNSLLSTISNLH